MANRPYILVYKDPKYKPTFWYRPAIYFDLKVFYRVSAPCQVVFSPDFWTINSTTQIQTLTGTLPASWDRNTLTTLPETNIAPENGGFQ